MRISLEVAQSDIFGWFVDKSGKVVAVQLPGLVPAGAEWLQPAVYCNLSIASTDLGLAVASGAVTRRSLQCA